MAGASSERHANANLRSLARNPVGDDAVDAERGQYQAQTGEGGHEEHEETAGRDSAGGDRSNRAGTRGGLGGIQRSKRGEDRGGERRGGRGGSGRQMGGRRVPVWLP